MEDQPPRQLSRAERAGALAVAAVLGTLGAVAVFTTDNEAGTAVLLGAALVLFAVGWLDFVPQRLRIGETEVDLATRALARTLDSGRAEVAAEVAADVVEVAQERTSMPPSSAPLVAKARTVLFESATVNALLRALPPGVAFHTGGPGEPDVVLTGAGPRKVAVELKYLGRSAPRRMREAMAQALHWAASGDFDAVLLLTDVPAELPRVAAPVPVLHACADDKDAMEQALRQALTGATD